MACPACGGPLYGWLSLPAPGEASGGEAGSVLLQRCESCGLGVRAGLGADGAVRALLESGREEDGRIALRLANRASVQARLGGRHWAALEAARALYPTPEAARLLAAVAGLGVEEVQTPARGRGQAWSWQTLVNAFTLRENFARDAWTRRLGPRGAGERARRAIDAVVTALAAIPLAAVSAPLELAAAWLGRGGELVVVARRAPGRGAGAPATPPGAMLVARPGERASAVRAGRSGPRPG